MDKQALSPFKQDVFDLGLLLFISALGGLELLDSKEFERLAAKPPDACCIFHYGNETPPQPGPLTINRYFTSKRYSEKFLDFLCKSLRFSESDRPSIKDLQHHPWLTSKVETKSPLVNLKELIQISSQWNISTNSTEYQLPAEKQLERICEAMASVLPCCENCEDILEKFTKGHIEKEAIKQLALDIGLDMKVVLEKLMEVIKGIEGNKDKL